MTFNWIHHHYINYVKKLHLGIGLQFVNFVDIIPGEVYMYLMFIRKYK